MDISEYVLNVINLLCISSLSTAVNQLWLEVFKNFISSSQSKIFALMPVSKLKCIENGEAGDDIQKGLMGLN
jgi:hypothetical protein